MMPQSQNADYSNGSNNNALAIAVAPQNGQYTSNNSISGQISMINSSVPNQNLMAAALHLNQYNPGYSNSGLATIGYIYPNNNSLVQASNLVFNPHNILHPPVEMIPSGPSSLSHIGNTALHHTHKLSGYDNMQHFGSLSQNMVRKPKNSVMSKTNLYINGLQESDTDESVRALVDGIIEPKSCKAMLSHGKCRGSGFIDCASEADAERVINILRNRQMPGGTRLAVKFAYENEKDDLNVYVRNLPRISSFNSSNLEDLFKDFGQVVSVKLLQSDNQYTGTGFVRFSAADEAQKAVDQMNMKKLMLSDDEKPVICKLADKGGRRINHNTMMHVNDSCHSMDGGADEHHGMANGSGSGHISCEGNDKGYGVQMMAHQGHQQYAGMQGHPWLNHPGMELLAQELQSLSMAQHTPNYLVPGGVMQAPLTSLPYGDEATTAAIMHQHQQQQLIAQILWTQSQQNQQQRLMASSAGGGGVYHQGAVNQQSGQAQPMLHWPHHHGQGQSLGVSSSAAHSAGHGTGGVYYQGGGETAYQAMVYPGSVAAPQYRHGRPGPSTPGVASTKCLEPAQATLVNGGGGGAMDPPGI